VEMAQVRLIGRTGGALTDSAGRFVLRGVTAGRATVEIKAYGYRPLVQDVAVAAGQSTHVTLVLRQTTVVTVLPDFDVQAASPIDSTRSETGHRANRPTLRDMAGDDPLDVPGLFAGLVAKAGELHTQGLRGDATQVQINGVVAVDPMHAKSADVAAIAVEDI